MSQGYTAVGPVIVAGVTSTAVQIQAGRGRTQDLELAGKMVSVLNAQGMGIPFSALRQGTRITYLVKGNSLVIIVLPKEDNSNA